MERRNFLRLLVGGVAAVAAERTFPFRVFSFPREIVVLPAGLTGLRYSDDWINSTGTWYGLSRSPVPGVLKTPHVNLNPAPALGPIALRQLRRFPQRLTP